MDVNMPEISGLEATEAIRYDEKSRGRSPTFIVALTAGVSEEERRACTTLREWTTSSESPSPPAMLENPLQGP